MKVLLVFPPHQEIDAYYVTPSIGLLSLATVLKQYKYEVEIQDHIYYLRSNILGDNKLIYKNAAKLILDANPDVVGFYTQCVTYPSCLNIAKRIKMRKPEIKVIFGGHNSTFLDFETLNNFPFVDIIVRGEGEKVIINLMKSLENIIDISQVKGITYRNSDNKIIRNEDEELIENLDELPFLDYTFVPDLNKYRKLGKSSTILIESGRGCTYNCIFCSNCRMWKRKVRFKSVDRIIQEIKFFEEKYHPDEYYFVHDFFTFNKEYIKELCLGLKKHGINIRWSCRCRLNITKGILQLIKDAGCERVLFGVESGSKKILAVMSKQVDFDIIFETIKNTIEVGIIPSLSFVMGLPEETYQDVNATLSLILKCSLIGNCYPFMQMISPLPGTPVIKNYSSELELMVDTAFSRGITYDNDEVMEEDLELIQKHPDIFSSFYNIRSNNVDIRLVSEIARNYCYIIEMFAQTYYYLLAEYNLSEIELYLRWRKWLIKTKKSASGELSEMKREIIWEYFSQYIHYLIRNYPVTKYEFISELFRYQEIRYRMLEQAEPSISKFYKKSVNTVGANSKFWLNHGVEVSEFRFDIKEIINDLKSFICTEYEEKEAFFAFCRDGYNVNIYKITKPLYLIMKLAKGVPFDKLSQKVKIEKDELLSILDMLIEEEFLICS